MPTTVKNNRPVILQLAVPSPLRKLFDYLPPAGEFDRPVSAWKPGMRLLVPFGRRRLIAVLAGISTTSDLPVQQLKRALAVLDDEPLFPRPLLRTLQWAASYYQHPPGEVFSAALPARLRQGEAASLPAETVWAACQGADESLLQRAPRQQALLETLQRDGPLSRAQCLAAGFSDAVLQALAGRGLIHQQSRQLSPTQAAAPAAPGMARQPNPEQQAAIEAISDTLDRFACHLLDGITGSGKTEVYLQVIARVLAEGRQALLLVPEIGLTPQSVQGLKDRFQCELAVLHSGLTDNERLTAWLKARSGAASIVIGTRSAVFTPLARPGLIVIDEEHDGSFKQQDGFRYSARDLAVYRAREEQISILLGSATPALESLHNARAGRYRHLRLRERAGTAARPPISLLDINREAIQDGFSQPLLDLLGHHLARGNQVLVFINRRGFAPSLACADCGSVFECRRCDAQLTVHKSPPLLRCHHCDSQHPIPAHCPDCGSRELLTRGMGTEKSEHLLQARFQPYPVLRIDSDSTRRKHALSERLALVHQGKPCILVGTQMLAKGHHFPGVTLVAVLDADSGLFSADFRGQEHMVQLLFQVAGRAGRAEHPGQVVVQTRHPTHASLQALVAHDYHEIADLLLQERRESNMPPYCHLALFRAESPDHRHALALLAAIRQVCQEVLTQLRLVGIELHHPVPAPMERRAGRYRAQLLVKAGGRSPMQRLLGAACQRIEGLKAARQARWSVDVDPVDLT